MEDKVREYIANLHESSIGTDLEEKWYCLVGCSFTASNHGKFVAEVFKQAISKRKDDVEYHKFVLRRIKESILKTSMIYGIPRVLNALWALASLSSLSDLDEQAVTRAVTINSLDFCQRGEEYLRNVFRDDMGFFLEKIDNHWPDLRTLIVTYAYGYYQSDLSILDAVTTSQANIASLVPIDAADQVAWHMRSTIRNGGTKEQAEVAFEIALAVCDAFEIVLKNKMPVVEEVIFEARLMLD